MNVPSDLRLSDFRVTRFKKSAGREEVEGGCNDMEHREGSRSVRLSWRSERRGLSNDRRGSFWPPDPNGRGGVG